jgi:hypothetical protein
MRRFLQGKMGFLAVLGLILALGSGVGQAQNDSYTHQVISLNSALGNLVSYQAIGGFYLWDLDSNQSASLNFQKTHVTGMLSINTGIGTGKNQACVIQMDFIPTPVSRKDTIINVPVFNQDGWMSLENNTMLIGNSSYTTNISPGSITGSGIVAVNQMAGSLNNQLTAVRISVGPRAGFQAVLPGGIISTGDSTLVGLSNNQLAMYAVTSNNTINQVGEQSGKATVDSGAFKDFTGIVAVNQVSGTMNQVLNNVRVNVNMQ